MRSVPARTLARVLAALVAITGCSRGVRQASRLEHVAELLLRNVVVEPSSELPQGEERR